MDAAICYRRCSDYGISRIGASLYGIDNIWDSSHLEATNFVVQVLHKFDGFGGLALSLMLPIVAGISALLSRISLV
ncbi:hypothetical protein LHK12_08385 [Providencia rettgeri]|nr:hypothetical protein [Providencia rettgeri]